MDTQLPLSQALTALGELLVAEGAEVRLVVVGGAALNLLGIVERFTRDVDVIALATGDRAAISLRDPEPLPDVLKQGIATVARDLRLPDDWMNVQVASQWKTGLPPGLADLQWRRFGGLLVGLPDRLALICLKVYAAADQTGPDNRHMRDLLALRPSPGELERATAWIETQDPTIGAIVAKVAAYVLNHVR